MGRAGSDLALDTADAVIMRDDLAAIPAIITLSRRARRVITANLAIAAAIIAALVAWDLAGHLPVPLGVAGHEGSTVIVGLNGLRLLRGSAWRKALTGARHSEPGRERQRRRRDGGQGHDRRCGTAVGMLTAGSGPPVRVSFGVTARRARDDRDGRRRRVRRPSS